MVKIEPHNPESFFLSLHSTTQIYIPIFQRKFCWLPKYVTTLWNNICKSSSMNGHHIGKIFLQQHQTYTATTLIGSSAHSPCSTDLSCIDGQQRLSTLMICLCAMRDLILEEEETFRMPENEKSSPHKQYLHDMLNKLHRILFVNAEKHALKGPVQFLEELSNTQQLLNSTREQQSEWFLRMKQHSRLVPSRDDRKTFFAVLIGLSRFSSLKEGNFNPWILFAYHFFYNAIKKDLNRFPSKKIERLQSFHMTHVLQHVRFVTVEYQQNEMNAQERFKDLYHTGKANQILFFIKTPGIDLAQSDLIKNHVLSLFKTEEKQFEMYEKYWLPMERRFCTFENISLNANDGGSSLSTVVDASYATLETLQSRELDIFIEWFVFNVKHSEHNEDLQNKYKKFQQQKEQSQQLPLIMQLGMYSSGTEPSLFNEFIATLFPSSTSVEESHVEEVLARMLKSLDDFFMTLHRAQEELSRTI
ncbi:hypothetical protein FDP41_001308 [Naegleria fowleri]|uniref:GmrSD restriction endonucleases N-terminal domain-containing protein n=1 Tax=Naegleria fowleri TaxID=5763 RepID=A0A6A5C1A2_NAEFO|nr:uncharacterized protein FDP41_001308 [Naegleria fowleri]KAF0979640.1 hypothetical protein FDP41_001308 [Naegleria fowleri]